MATYAAVTDVTIAATATSIDTANPSGARPLLVNLSNETITLTFPAKSGDTFALEPGEGVFVPAGALVTGTAAGGAAPLQVLRGIIPAGLAGILSATFDESTGSIQVTRINPEWSHTGPLQYTASGLGDGTYYVYFDMEGYHYFSIQLDVTDGAAGDWTVKAYGSARNDGTGQESVVYFDKTQAWFGAASFTADALLEKNTPTSLKYVRIELVRANDGGGTDGAYAVDIQRS